jgi:hypothetical protein
MRRALLAIAAVLLGLGLVGVGAAAALWLVAPRGPEPVRYTVVKGDTLGVIAKSYGVSVDELRDWNGISGDRIEIGQVLIVGDGSPVAAAPPPAKKRPRRSGGGTVTADHAPDDAPPPLVMPPAQRCKAGPTDVAGDEGMAGSVGLSEDEVRAAMRGFVGNTLRCFPPDTASGTILTAILVGCDGRVSKVDVEDDGGMPGTVAACVADTLRYTPFPAHDMPDGFAFEYPLRFEAP